MNFRIERWNGQPGVAETLAAWHVREWAGLFAEWDETAARSEFQAQLHHTGHACPFGVAHGKVHHAVRHITAKNLQGLRCISA